MFQAVAGGGEGRERFEVTLLDRGELGRTFVFEVE